MTSIGEGAFEGCRSLTSITIPNSVTSIGESSFEGCDNLESINVDTENAYYTSVDGVLYNKDVSILLVCPGGKTSVTIPNSVTSIGVSAFYDCDKLAAVTIPNSVTSIGVSAFYDCDKLAAITIPNSVTSIGDYTFYKCSSLTTVTIGNSVTSIGERAFYECDKLTTVTIPNSVTSIGNGAFADCSSLTTVTIPNSVTTIGDNAFSRCSSLESFYMQCEVPVECEPDIPDNVLKSAVLYVPTGTLSVYEKVDPWRNFWNIKEMDFSGVDGIEGGGKFQVSVENGCITVGGNYECVTVYNMQGRVVYSGSSQVIDNLAPGIYIVRAGSQTAKVSI